MKLDVLVFAAHPDDAELSCAGTIYTHVMQGKKVGLIDLTRGELGTRGTPEIRSREAEAASKILKLAVRENLGFRDGFFQNDENHQLEIVKMIRKYQPDIVLANAVHDRHPDHGRAAKLLTEAIFLSGLKQVKTFLDHETQAAWRPNAVYHYIQSLYLKPDIIVDVSDAWPTKMAAIKAYKSQFYDPDSNEPETYISRPGFMEMITARGKEFGYSIGTSYGEGFTAVRNMGAKSLFDLL